jgi:hypothetical protein
MNAMDASEMHCTLYSVISFHALPQSEARHEFPAESVDMELIYAILCTNESDFKRLVGKAR